MMTCNKLGLFIHSLVNAVVILGHIQKAKMGSFHSLYYVPNCCTIYSLLVKIFLSFVSILAADSTRYTKAIFQNFYSVNPKIFGYSGLTLPWIVVILVQNHCMYFIN